MSETSSAPIAHFVLGMFAMIGAMVFLGCPWRALFRLTGGDLNAMLGLAGLAAGVWFLKNGYSLGRSRPTHAAVGWIMPVIRVGLLLLAVLKPTFSEGGPIFSSETGPGSLYAPLLISLIAGLVIGILAQRTRFRPMGSIRDVILKCLPYGPQRGLASAGPGGRGRIQADPEQIVQPGSQSVAKVRCEARRLY